MTTAADDRAVEEAFEAALTGRPVPGGAAGLAAFTSAVRGTVTQPGRPNAALAELLSTGLLADQSSPSARTAPAAGSLPSRRTRSRTRRRFTVIVPALIAKFLSAGAVAQAATGAGVVVVVVTGAGAVGALPGTAQETFDDVTGTSQTAEGDGSAEVTTAPTPTAPSEGSGATPTDVTVPSGSQIPVTATPSDAPVISAEDEVTEAEWREGPADGQPFGEWVSYGRHMGWATGPMSSAAHERNEDRKAAGKGEETETPEVPEVEDEVQDEVEEESSDEGDSNGKDRGKGRGGRG